MENNERNNWQKECSNETFNKSFFNIGSNLANKIPQCDLTFKSYFPIVNTTLKETR